MERKLALSVCSVPGSAPCISVSWQIRLLGFRDRMLLTSHSSGMIPSLWTPTPKLQKEPGRGWRFRMSLKKLVASVSGGFLTSDPPLTYYRLPHPCLVKPTGLPPNGNAMLPDPTSSTSQMFCFSPQPQSQPQQKRESCLWQMVTRIYDIPSFFYFLFNTQVHCHWSIGF